jgi:glycosyltransferase involved in cell wall biosynthesis|tara:strand:- start:10311 stop:11261 length:951 start_codon:yes stop_codon:yes gene_type:complete
VQKSLLITIGLTCYNAEDTLSAAVECALQQDWDNVEIIIIDDCSTDSSYQVATDYQKSYQNIKVYKNDKNRGVAFSRNEIIQKASGALIAFFDDDDISAPTRLSAQYQAIIKGEAQHKLVICHTARKQLYPDSSNRIEPVVRSCVGVNVAKRILYGRPTKEDFIGSYATCSQAARTSVYKELLGFDVKFRRCEDTDFAVRAALYGAAFIGIDTPLVTQTMTSSSDKTMALEKLYFRRLLDKHSEFLRQENRYKHTVKWLDLKYDYYEGNKFKLVWELIMLLATNPVKTIQRILWSMPNQKFNKGYKKYKKEGGYNE